MIIFQQVLLVLIIFICAYTLLDRLCKCIVLQQKHMGNYGVLTSLEKVQEQLKKFKEAGHETKNKESGMD